MKYTKDIDKMVKDIRKALSSLYPNIENPEIRLVGSSDNPTVLEVEKQTNAYKPGLKTQFDIAIMSNGKHPNS